ncbi:MAG: hypothetical protein AB7G11_15045, partial [Phycisphaerales bacterium]
MSSLPTPTSSPLSADPSVSPAYVRGSSVRHRLARLVLGGAAALIGLGGVVERAGAQQILETYGTSLTSYKYASATGGQGVRPRFDQRGVGLDGSARAGSLQGWALAGNPLGEGSVGGGRLGAGINLATGTYNPTEVDIALPAPGGSRWVIGRSWNVRQEVGGTRTDSNGYQGKNWFQMSQPEIVLFTGATNDLDVLYIVYGADRYLEFKRAALNGNEFKGKNGAAGIVQYVSGSPDTYVYYDQRGTATTFFGFNTSGGAADGQFWKIADPNGNTAYVGDASTASTAVTNGYSGKKIQVAYDGADNDGRRYTYTYTTIDSVSRLTQVKAEVKTSGAWSSPSGVTTVGTVDYTYYTGSDSNGDNGNLKTVTTTTPLSPASTNLTRITYYRYYTGTYNASTNPGHANCLKMVLDAEGTRSYDWQDSTFDADYVADSDASIKSYASAYFEYESSSSTERIAKAYFNGQCGCGGGTNGTYEFTYGDSTSYSTYIGNTSYDTGSGGWGKRTVVKRPDTTYQTFYFDEVGQSLSVVTTDTDPAGSPSKT